MCTLVVAATEPEIGPLKGFVKRRTDIDILVSGVGGVATAYALARALSLKKYDLVIQAGIGGSFVKKTAPGSVVAVAADRFGDLGVREGGRFLDLVDMGLQKPKEGPYKNGWLNNPFRQLLKRTGLEAVAGVTVNQVSTAKMTISYFGTKLGVTVESMEGAAFHYVALKEKVPFLQLRSISNYVGERSKEKWKLKESVQNLNEVVMRLLQIKNEERG